MSCVHVYLRYVTFESFGQKGDSVKGDGQMGDKHEIQSNRGRDRCLRGGASCIPCLHDLLGLAQAWLRLLFFVLTGSALHNNVYVFLCTVRL